MRVKTMKITTPHGHSVINATDYDPEVHTPYQPDTEFTGEKVRELEAGGTLSEDEAKRRSSIEIPEEWRDAHFRTNVTLAQEITGDESLSTKDEAIAAIDAELIRRATNVDD